MLNRQNQFNMKSLLLFLFLGTIISYGQSPLRETLSMAGGTTIVNDDNKQYLLHESIGQHSSIFTFNTNNEILRQGYVQPIYPSGVQGNPADLDIVVYPNPFTELVKIQIKENVGENILVSLFDFQGRLIRAKEYSNATNLEISLNTISQGVYFLKVSSDEKRQVVKIVKQ